MDLGFYYMANAVGRLAGVLIGGFLYHYTVSRPPYACPPARPLLTVIWPCQLPTKVDRAPRGFNRIVAFVACDNFAYLEY